MTFAAIRASATIWPATRLTRPRSPSSAPRSRAAGTSPRSTREVRESQRRRRLVDAALTKGEVRAWDFQPFRDASKQYMRNTMDLDDLEAMARFPACRPPPEDATAGNGRARARRRQHLRFPTPLQRQTALTSRAERGRDGDQDEEAGRCG